MNTNQSYEDPSKYPADTEKASELLDEALIMMWCGGLDWATSDDFKDLRESDDVGKADAAYLLYQGNLVMKLKAQILQSFRSVSDIREACRPKTINEKFKWSGNQERKIGYNQAVNDILASLNIEPITKGKE